MIRISLVIPTHNRAEELLRALSSVVRQDLPAEEWECVVVSNNSTDDTESRFADFVAEHPACNLRLVCETGPGVSYARNRGLREARAPWVACIDDDERINEGFLRAYVEFFETHPEAVVAGGRIIAEYPSGRPDWMSHYVEMPVANPMDFGAEVRPFPRGRVPGGGNMAFRLAGLTAYGGFDPSLGRVNGELIGGEENDLFERLLQGGETIWYVPQAVMWHIIPPRKLTRDYFRRLSYNVGVSQRLRARIHHRLPKALLMELFKWGATLLLCCTMSPFRSLWLLRMRWNISRGLFRPLPPEGSDGRPA
ncbi:glycosyltransferase family 2 protein [Alistipes sp.]|uniref:glycosyltransferase family 2 protein n=1 Tax=Alistipes sp. TaxID=1872444 RepID=UPI003A88D6AE